MLIKKENRKQRGVTDPRSVFYGMTVEEIRRKVRNETKIAELPEERIREIEEKTKVLRLLKKGLTVV